MIIDEKQSAAGVTFGGEWAGPSLEDWLQRISDGALRAMGLQPASLPWIKPATEYEAVA